MCNLPRRRARATWPACLAAPAPRQPEPATHAPRHASAPVTDVGLSRRPQGLAEPPQDVLRGLGAAPQVPRGFVQAPPGLHRGLKMNVLMLMCPLFANALHGPIDEAIKAMKEQMDRLENKMMAKDETIAALTAALQSKTEHRQVQLTAGGEVMQLVSDAEFKELAARVAACEKTTADLDAKLGMTMDILVKVRKEIKDRRVNAPPPVATPGRRLQSSSDGDSVNELSITGPNAVTSWNSRTPGLTPFNCTGVGDGKLTCSGEFRAADFVTADGFSLSQIGLHLGLNAPPDAPPPPPASPPIVALPRVSIYMSTTNEVAMQGCINDVIESNYGCHSSRTASGLPDEWLSIDMGQQQTVNHVTVHNRVKDGCDSRLGNFEVWIGDSAGSLTTMCGTGSACNDPSHPSCGGVGCNCGNFGCNADSTFCCVEDTITVYCQDRSLGRYVTLLLPGNNRVINLREVYLYGF